MGRKQGLKEKRVSVKSMQKLEKLKLLLSQVKQAEAQKPVELKEEQKPKEPEIPQPSAPQPELQPEIKFWPSFMPLPLGEKRYVEPVPKRLRGFSFGEIMTLKEDGGLNEEEEKWLGRRTLGRFL